MKQNRRQLLICIAIPLAAGGLSAWLTRGSMDTFAALNKPPLSPPGWLFPVVWTILFVLMGLASYLVLKSGKPQQKVNRALRLYGIKLGVNFFWSVFFYLAHPSVDSDPSYHDTIPQALTADWYADASISAVGRLRRISEPGNLSAELKHLPNRDLMKHHLQPFGAWR